MSDKPFVFSCKKSIFSAGVTFKASDKKEIKHFTAFFSVEGDNIDPDNDIKKLIASQIGAECEET